jgi:hypothetical protein
MYLIVAHTVTVVNSAATREFLEPLGSLVQEFMDYPTYYEVGWLQSIEHIGSAAEHDGFD